MDKGQHLRILLTKQVSNTDSQEVIALATDFTFHASASTENSTTKDSTDTTGQWDEFEITSKTYDISVSALIAYESGAASTDNAWTLEDFLDGVSDTPINWELGIFGGSKNRVKIASICSGQCKITSLNPVGQNRQNATYSATLNGYGPITVSS